MTNTKDKVTITRFCKNVKIRQVNRKHLLNMFSLNIEEKQRKSGTYIVVMLLYRNI